MADPNDIHAHPGLNGKTVAQSQPSLAELVKGIMTDAQSLIQQQLSLLRAEIRDDLRRSSQAVRCMGVGYTVFAAGMLLILFGVV